VAILEVMVGFDGAHDIGDFVVLGDDNKSDRGVEIKSRTCTCALAGLRRRGRSLGERTRGKGEKEKGRASDEIELFFDNCFEFSFRDSIFGNIRHVGTGYRTKTRDH
jgi:hypothetical protein